MPRAGKIRWNVKAFQDLRRSAAVEARLQKEVSRVLAEIGDVDGTNYVGGVEPGKSRSRGYVVTASPEAMIAEAEDHALIRALGSGT